MDNKPATSGDETPSKQRQLMKGDVVTIHAESLSGEGTSVGRFEGRVCFIEAAVPGDVAGVRLFKIKKQYLAGRAVEILSPSELRTDPVCHHFGVCGGCRWQNLGYDAQLEFKRRRVADVFQRIGGITGVEVLPVKGCPDRYHYRNKMEFTFANERWLTSEEMHAGEDVGKELSLGLHLPERYNKILDLRECHLQSETGQRIMIETRNYFRERGLDAYSTRSHEGYLRHLVIREGKRTGQTMVNIVTTDDRPGEMKSFVEYLLGKFPGITTVVNNITDRKAMVAQGDVEAQYHGDGTIAEKIGNFQFRISANSFFQTNTIQAEVLFETVKTMAGLRSTDVVYDLYCGTGTIAICLSGEVDRVIGIESNESAVLDAARNARENRVANCYFLRGNLPGDLDPRSEMLRDHPPPTVVVVDPPRNGLHEKLIRKVLAISPERIVYVSCNAATQARDVKIFVEGGYRPGPVQPVDMFPHTDHLETVTVLRK